MSQPRNPLNKTIPHSVYVPDSVNQQIVKMAEVSGMSVSEYLVWCAKNHLDENKKTKDRLDYVFQESQ